jgi:glutathione synthase/RimK-type ligase-like ATP-grasp enzyme
MAQEVRAGHAEALHAALSVWLDVTPAFVVNRPAAMALNASKPYQAALIEAAGLRTPPTLLTTDPDAVASFRNRHGTVIYKSISAMRSIVARLRAEDEARLRDVSWCPTQFQRRIGGFEVRVHVVGDEVFASRVISEADDYRYASLTGQDMDIASFELPAEIAALCRKVTRALGYVIAGIDLRCEDDAWYCFEANPSPSFTYYEQRTGQPIAAAVADLLAGALTSRKDPATPR